MDFSRYIYSAVKDKLKSNKVLILAGARRVGKTHLIKTIQAEFTGKSMFLNGEDLDTVSLLSTEELLLSNAGLGILIF
jgi:predicted AAA+ superfamily ATPase